MSYTLFTIISSLKIKRAAKLDLRKFAARLEIIIFFICKKVKRGLPDGRQRRLAGWQTFARHRRAFFNAVCRFSCGAGRRPETMYAAELSRIFSYNCTFFTISVRLIWLKSISVIIKINNFVYFNKYSTDV